MTYQAYEQSEDLGQPVELYQFLYSGSGQIAYCSGDTPVVFGGVTYDPMPINRGTVTSSGGTDKTTLNVDVPTISSIVQLFAIYPPSSKIVMIVRQGHYGDPDNDFPVVWTGQVYTCARAASQANMARLTCRPASVSLQRTGLRTHYQISCPKVLYGDKCRADKTAATRASIISSKTYTTITLPANWYGVFNPQKFVNGTVEWVTALGREYRTILKVSGTGNVTLSLSAPTTDLSNGQAIDVILGCDKQPFSDCRDLHNNIQNYGGCCFAPKDNPLGTNPF